YLTDLNLAGPTGRSLGEGGRALYGSIDPATGEATPGRRSLDFGPVLSASNTSGDRALSFSVELQKSFARGAELRASYTFTRSRDRMSVPDDFIFYNYHYAPVEGPLEHRSVSTSLYEVPHRLTALVGANLPYGLRATMVYQGVSGSPYSYVVNGD